MNARRRIASITLLCMLFSTATTSLAGVEAVVTTAGAKGTANRLPNTTPITNSYANGSGVGLDPASFPLELVAVSGLPANFAFPYDCGRGPAL